MTYRKSITFYLNGKRQEIAGDLAFTTLSDFLRYDACMPGTKVVCAEGDCGACTVLQADVLDSQIEFKSVNSCIMLMGQVDGTHLITVEALNDGEKLHPVQDAFVNNFGSQCGYCTPGFVCAMTAFVDKKVCEKKPIEKKALMNSLTGNLCRCTGYEPIIEAGLSVDTREYKLLKDRYHHADIQTDLKKVKNSSLEVKIDKVHYFAPATLKEALDFKQKYPMTKMISGATDLGVLNNKNKFTPEILMSLQNIAELKKISETNDSVKIGALASLHEVEKASEKHFPEFANMIHIFASPQIKNRATLVGNVANASPIADTIPFLMVSEAKIELASSKGTELVNINDFYLGYKKLKMNPEQIITGIIIPKTTDTIKLYKASLRRDLDISAVTFAAALKKQNGKIENIKIAYGGVAATVIRMKDAENLLKQKDFSKSHFQAADKLIQSQINPLSDVRGSGAFRRKLVKNLLLKFREEVGAV